MTEQQQQKQQAIDLLESRYRGMENVSDDDNSQTGGNGGGNNNPPSGELEG